MASSSLFAARFFDKQSAALCKVGECLEELAVRRNAAEDSAIDRIMKSDTEVLRRVGEEFNLAFSAERLAASTNLLAVLEKGGDADPKTSVFYNRFASLFAVPSKVLEGKDRFHGFVSAKARQSSKEAVLEAVHAKMRRRLQDSGAAHSCETFRAELAIVAAERSIAREKYKAFIPLSDHLPIKVTLRSTAGVVFHVFSQNIQEFVKDGLSNYLCTLPCIVGSKGKGAASRLCEFLVEPESLALQECHVANFVLKCLSDDKCLAVCLQEVTPRMLVALQGHLSHRGDLAIHASSFEDNLDVGKCFGITLIVFRCQEGCEAQNDIVAHYPQRHRTRRFACIFIPRLDTILVSVHALHPHRSHHCTQNREHILISLNSISRASKSLPASAILAVGDFNGTLCEDDSLSSSFPPFTFTSAMPESATQFGKMRAVDGSVLFVPKGRQCCDMAAVNIVEPFPAPAIVD